MKHLALIAIGLLIVPGCGESDDAKSATNAKPIEPDSTVAAAPDASADKGTQPTDDAPTEAMPADTTGDVAESGAEKKVSAEDRYADIKGRFDEAMMKFRKAYSAASAEERQKVYEDSYPDGSEYAAEYVAFAKEYPEAPEAVQALSWAAARGDAVTKGEAMDILLKNHGDADEIAGVISGLAYDSSENTEKQLRELSKEAANDKLKGIATLTLASFIGNVVRTQKYLEANPDADMGENQDYIVAFKEKSGEREALYEEVLANYANISTRRGTLGDSATAALFELRNLQVGMDVPDIEGADLDGVDFKLSDYKGKVVLLDFWGNW